MSHAEVHPGWGRAARPRSIAILGWARLPLQGAEGSGYNLSASELAAGLALRGHRVSYLGAGVRYSWTLRPRIARTQAWRGVECFTFFNSPNPAPAFFNFNNMEREINSPGQTRRVLRWLDRVAAEIVHVHSLEGFGLDLIAAMRASGRAVVVTPHNHWYVCPQVDLLHREREVCADYEGGTRCVGCLNAPSPARARLRRALGHTLERAVGAGAIEAARALAKAARARLAHGAIDGDRPRVLDRAPDPELADGFEAGPTDHPGTIEHSLSPTAGEIPPAFGRAPLDQNERFLEADEARRDGRRGAPDRHLAVLNQSVYGRRRLAGIEALNHASLVTPPSDFVRRVLERMGLEPARARTVRLGQPHFDQLHRRAARSPGYDAVPWTPSSPGPLRLGFFGTVRNNKGLDVLARAIPMLSRAVRTRCQFIIRAAGGDWAFRRRLSAYPEVSFAGGYDLLQLIAMMGEVDVGILPHVWFENSPLVLLEFLHAGKFVIASRLGGPPEWIVEGQNGVMFAGGDSAGLAGKIADVVDGRVGLPTPRRVHETTPNLQSYPGHVVEMERVYGSLG